MEQNSFGKGIRDGIPICLGYLAVSFGFGISAASSMNLSVLQTVLISMFNLTSAGQIAGAPIIAGFGSLLELALTQLTINLRYSLMSISLSQKLGKSVRFIDRFWISFFVTDEIFAVSSANSGTVGRRYMAGLALTPYLGWTFGTLFGAVAGNILPAIVVSALSVAIYGMFIAIVVPPCKKSKSTLFCVLFAIGLSCLFKYTPYLNQVSGGFVIIICAVVASLLFAFIAPIKDEENEKGVEENA